MAEKNIPGLVKQILDKGYLMSLATVDNSGPWVSDVIYVADDNLSLYWLSLTNRRHSQAIALNPKVAASITLTARPGEADIGLQIEGNAKKIKGDVFEMAKKHRAKRGKPAPKKLGEILDKGESWYCLRPKKIEIIYSPLFGWNKKVLNL